MTWDALPDGIRSRIKRTETCWLWTGSTAGKGYRVGKGYGVVWWQGKQHPVHRVIFQLLVGPIPPGYHIDHVRARGCTSRMCVNPAHLEAVTPAENNARSDSVTALKARQTLCIRGHEFDGVDAKGSRLCLTCKRERERKYRQRAAAPCHPGGDAA